MSRVSCLRGAIYDAIVDLRPDSPTYQRHFAIKLTAAKHDALYIPPSLVFTHVCHPSLCNDNLSGVALATLVARELAKERPHLSYRFVFAPGTIGSITWLARNEERLAREGHAETTS
jgi:aminopeptidase-like protein